MNTIPELLSETVAKHKNRIAIVEEGKKVSYLELQSMVNSLSSYLTSLGVKPGDRVAILLPNSIEFIAGFFSTVNIGAISVPVNPSYGEEEIRFYISHSMAKLILTQERLSKTVDKLKGPESKVVVVKGGERGLFIFGEEKKNSLRVSINPHDEAIYLYSTGSTGKPKRVSRTHLNIIALANNHTETIGWSEEDRILLSIPMSHTYGFGNFISAIKAGACIYTVEGFNRRKIFDLIERERITVFPAVPFMLEALANTPFPRPIDFSSLKFVISAGAPLSKETFERFFKRFQIPPRQLYGSTETGVIAINLSKDIENRFSSVGQPVKNVEVKIFREDGSQADIGEIGEIAVKSPSMTTGYHDLPEETQRSFRNGYYFTGDLGKIDEDGYIYIVGRKKLFINISGNKVDPQEVENVISRHPKVREVAVVGIRERDEKEAVKAVIVPKEKLEAREIYEFCRGKISDFKIPRIIEFREKLPKSPTGKVLREKLR